MTLEDFFTLTEMKDGLSTLGRVEDLVSVMQQRKECVVSNIGDAARQWSTVASTLALTESKNCLNHFIQLNGLCFFNQWLREAQKSDNAASGDVAEELIEALLTSLERLPTDVNKSYFSEIWLTIEQLLVHESPVIKERARMLVDKWNHVKNDDASHHNVGNMLTCVNAQCESSVDKSVIEQNLHFIHPICEVPPSRRGDDEGIAGSSDKKSERTESHHSNVAFCCDISQMETTKDVKVPTEIQTTPTTALNSTGAGAHLSNCFQQNLLMQEESSVRPVGLASVCSSPSRQKRRYSNDQNDDGSVSKDEVTNTKEVGLDTEEAIHGQNDICNDVSNAVLSACVPVQVDAREPNAPCDSAGKYSEPCMQESTEPQQKSDGFHCGMAKCSRTTNEFDLLSSGSKGFQDLSSNSCIMDDTDTSSKWKDAVGSAGMIEEFGSEGDEAKGQDFEIPSDSPKAVEIKETEQLNQELGLELDEEFDPLAVARQVAIEVEREVVDYREPFCSSPEANSGETRTACSPDSVQINGDEAANGELMKDLKPTGNDLHDRDSFPKQETSRISENVTSDPEGCEVDLETQNSSFIAQEAPRNLDKNICDFDLNEDACMEEFHASTSPRDKVSVNLSAPIAVVAASKGVPVLPVAPLHFQGELGWKGSAATSAFRPASPRRTPEGENTYSASKPRLNFLEIDLNVAEREDDVAVNPVKQAPVSSGLLSGDSSVEVSSRRAERLKLDLNRLGNEDTSSYPSSYWRFNQQNGGDHCQSTTSSSSSRQPSVRDFDLNDNPSFLDAGSSQNSNSLPFKSSGINGMSKVDDPVITLMGARMTVERKEYSSQAQQSFMERGPSVDSRIASRPVLPYASMLPPAFPYNGFAPGPAISISPPLYEPVGIQYMVDSRGATVIPQVLGSPGLYSGHPTRPSFLTSVANASSSFYGGGGSSHPGLDLNSVMTLESGSRLLLEEQSVNPSQPAGSGVALKRKEPDCGLEPYPFGYKQVTSWR